MFHSGRNTNVIFLNPKVAFYDSLLFTVHWRGSIAMVQKPALTLLQLKYLMWGNKSRKAQRLYTTKENNTAATRSCSAGFWKYIFSRTVFINSKHSTTITCHTEAVRSQTILPAIVSDWKQKLVYLHQSLHTGRMATSWRKMQCCFTCRIRCYCCIKHALHMLGHILQSQNQCRSKTYHVSSTMVHLE